MGEGSRPHKAGPQSFLAPAQLSPHGPRAGGPRRRAAGPGPLRTHESG